MAPQREWFETDYYKILGVDDKATDKEITRSYRSLAKKYHPDAHPGSEDKFKEVSAAYEVLGDADKRKEYDEVRRLGPLSGMAGGTGGPGGFNFHIEDLSDLFGGLFRGGGGTATRTRPRGTGGPQRGSDVEALLHLDFQEAVDGVIASVNVTTGAVCHACAGLGTAPGSSPVVCPRCGGIGVLNDNQGLFSLSSPCPECGGRGTKILDPCPVCGGSGVEPKGRVVKVRIPAGVDDGQRIRVKGRGEAGRNGGPAGDLYVTVQVAPHPLFGRRGKDLTLTVPISFSEAALGGTIRVPSLGDPISLKVPAGTKSGRTFRVRGRGLKSGTAQGDLLVTVEVEVPRHLSDEQRKALEDLAAATTESPRAYLGT